MTEQEIETFLVEPRLAILMYKGNRPGPTGVPVWFDWDGETVRMFASRTSPKVKQLQADPNISVLVTNKVGEPEGWVAFDGEVELGEFAAEDWLTLINRVAPRYWDLSNPDYSTVIEQWRSAPEAFTSLTLKPSAIRSGA